MDEFNPLKHIEGVDTLLDSDGNWPSFHDADVYTVRFWGGDLRPDEEIWIGPQIEVSVGIVGPRGESPLAILRLRFVDCDQVEFSGPGFGCPQIYSLEFWFEERGYLNDGRTPLTPYIHTRFSMGPSIKPLMSFRCFAVQGIGREKADAPPYA